MKSRHCPICASRPIGGESLRCSNKGCCFNKAVIDAEVWDEIYGWRIIANGALGFRQYLDSAIEEVERILGQEVENGNEVFKAYIIGLRETRIAFDLAITASRGLGEG